MTRVASLYLPHLAIERLRRLERPRALPKPRPAPILPSMTTPVPVRCRGAAAGVPVRAGRSKALRVGRWRSR